MLESDSSIIQSNYQFVFQLWSCLLYPEKSMSAVNCSR